MDVNSLSPTKRRSQTDGKENKVSHGHSLVPLVYNSSAIMQWCEPPNKQWDVEVDDSLTEMSGKCYCYYMCMVNNSSSPPLTDLLPSFHLPSPHE